MTNEEKLETIKELVINYDMCRYDKDNFINKVMSVIKGIDHITDEEKRLIIETPITFDCFEKWEDYHYEEIVVKNFEHPLEKMKKCTIHLYPTACFESLIKNCEVIRRKYLETKNKHYFNILIKMLPSSYKVVKL